VDQPVLLTPRLEERVPALNALPVEGDDHLVRLPFVELVRARVPDPHLAGAVLSLRDVALELQVLDRMVLGAHCLAVLLGILRDAVGDRPRGGRAVVLEPQVPVKARRVVFLDYEAKLIAAVGCLAGRLRRGAEVPLAFVLAELLGHMSKVDGD